MAYILNLIVVGLFFLVLNKFTELDKIQKATIAFLVFLAISGAITYNSYNNQQRDEMLNVVIKFKQDKTIKCNAIDVNQTNFTLSIGTYTFIGKKNTPYFGQMISASKCR